MDQEPLVSIGMPVYNGAKYLQEALDSLLAQDYHNFELIVSDNASEDETPIICKEYVCKDQRVQYFRNVTNIGSLGNFLRVFDLSSGKHFMWAAHDDMWSKNYISALLERTSVQPSSALSAPKTVYIDAAGKAYDAPHDLTPSEYCRYVTSLASRLPDLAPAGSYYRATGLARDLLEQQASSWIYGLFDSVFLRRAIFSLKGFPTRGGDILFLFGLCLRNRVSGTNSAVIYKRLVDTGVVVRPQTPRSQVKWQFQFTRLLYKEAISSPLSIREKIFLLGLCYDYTKRFPFQGGAKRNILRGLRALNQWRKGVDHL